MTNETKFRAWNKKSQTLSFWTLEQMLITKAVDSEEVSDCEWMQYTDLLDKNGTEIYEGDIFNSDKGTWIIKQGSWQFWDDMQLVRMYGWYAECSRNEGKAHHQLPLRPLQIELMGNIYESPDLLKS